MTFEQILPILLIIPILSLLLNFILMVFFVYILKGNGFKTKDQMEVENKILANLKKSRLESTQIVSDAAEKAKEIIASASKTSEEIQSKMQEIGNKSYESLHKGLEEESTSITNQFKVNYGKLMEEYRSSSQKMMINLQNAASQIQSNLQEDLKSQAVAIFSQMRDNTQKQIQETSQEINLYREDAFAKIEKEAKEMVKKSIADYFNTQIPLDSQEEIAMKSLEKFKEENKN